MSVTAEVREGGGVAVRVAAGVAVKVAVRVAGERQRRGREMRGPVAEMTR